MALVTVRITYGTINVTIKLDQNLVDANTWERLSGPVRACPSSGIWERLGGGAVFMNDSANNPVMILEAFRRASVGNTGSGLFQASGFVIPENAVFDWEVTRVEKEWWD